MPLAPLAEHSLVSPPPATRKDRLIDTRIHIRRATARITLVWALVGAGSCGGDTDGASASAEGALALAPSASVTRTPYAERALAASGRVTGLVEIDGTPPEDTIVRPSSDEDVCGAMLTDYTIERSGSRLGGVVVWIDGVRSGKPLPLERLYEITHTRCRVEPRVQAAIVGGTLNIRSLDPVAHRTRILSDAPADSATIINQTDAGQVVPVEGALRKPGQVELRCDLHPWTRAWIAVFDHPYFVVTSRDGAFTIDSVPPGRYRLAAWHERFGLVVDSVEVKAGGTAAVGLRMK